MQSDKQAGSLREKFQGFGAAPSDALWGNITDALEEKEGKRRGFIWWWIGTATAASLAIAWIFIGSLNTENPAPQTSDVTPIEQREDSDKEVARLKVEKTEFASPQDKGLDTDLSERASEITEEVVFETDKRIESERNVKTSELVSPDNYETVKLDNKVESLVDLEKEPPFKVVDNNATGGVLDDQLSAGCSALDFIANMDRPNIELLDQSLKMPSRCLCRFEIEEIPDRDWELGFSVAYWNDVQFDFEEEPQPVVLGTPTQTDNLITSGYSIITVENVGPPESVSGSIRSSLSIDGFIGKYFGKRWAWRVGLGFSRTSYSTDFPSSFTVANANSVLSSLTLPVSVRFDMIQKSRYKMRAGIAVHNEMPFLEKLNGNYWDSGEQLSYAKSKNVGYMGGLQFDLASEWKLNNNLGLTLTPSYRWFFTQNLGSQNALVRRDHWLGIAAGLRWKF